MRRSLLALLLLAIVTTAPAQAPRNPPDPIPATVVAYRFARQPAQVLATDWILRWNVDPKKDNERLYCIVRDHVEGDTLVIDSIAERGRDATPNSVSGPDTCVAENPGRGEFIHTHPSVMCDRTKTGNVRVRTCQRIVTAAWDEFNECKPSDQDMHVAAHYHLRYLIVQCAPMRFSLTAQPATPHEQYQRQGRTPLGDPRSDPFGEPR